MTIWYYIWVTLNTIFDSLIQCWMDYIGNILPFYDDGDDGDDGDDTV